MLLELTLCKLVIGQGPIPVLSVIVMVTVEFIPGVISGSERLDEMNSWKEWSPSMALSSRRLTSTQLGDGDIKSAGSNVTLDDEPGKE